MKSVQASLHPHKLGITHVLSTNGMPDYQLRQLQEALEQHNIQHYFISAEDEHTYDMMGLHWETCLPTLRNVKEQNDSRILVHCNAGMNRSGLIAIAAVMVLERITVLEALTMVKQKRGMLLTNLGFQKQLCELAAKEGLLGDKPLGYTDEPVVAPLPPQPPPRLALSAMVDRDYDSSKEQRALPSWWPK